MNRLYGIKIDKKRWKIITDYENYHKYKLVDKEKEDIYFFNDMIGLEQVNEDEFLIFSRCSRNQRRITRYKLENSKLIKLFTADFSHFHFITDDKILFVYWDNSARLRSSGIYSIQENNYVEESKWLNGKIIEPFNYNNNPDEIGLYVEEEIYSYKLGYFKLLFTVDPNTLQPNSDCYSQFRDNFIKINNNKDIENIKLEDQKSIEIIEKQTMQQEQESLQRAKEKILSKQ